MIFKIQRSLGDLLSGLSFSPHGIVIMRKSIVFLFGISICSSGWAQSVSGLHMRVDNDFFAFRVGRRALDFDYTSGLEFEVEFDGAPSWMSWPVAPNRDDVTLGLSLGQQIYTPRSRGQRESPGERPFAGWLYVAASVESETASTTRAASISVGVTGPPALAEQTQSSLHNLLGSYEVTGWENQLPFEPGFALRYEIARRFHLTQNDNFDVEVRSGVGIGLGTIWSGTSSEADLVVRSGKFAVFGGVRGEWIWRNEFLDGTAFRESDSAEKIPIVGQLEFGAHLRIGRFGVAARFITRSREYDGQPNSHQYGSLTTSLYF